MFFRKRKSNNILNQQFTGNDPELITIIKEIFGDKSVFIYQPFGTTIFGSKLWRNENITKEGLKINLYTTLPC